MSLLRHPGQLLAALGRGYRSRDRFALGLEYELFATELDGRALRYSGAGGVEELLAALAARTGWRRVEERGRLLGLSAPDGRGISLEPGAQVEFNSSPCATLSQLEDELREILGHLDALCREFGIRLIGLGAQPADPPERIERIPKTRYDLLEPYLAGAGELGLWMMKATCGTQVNFDHADAEDAALKMRTAFALAPIVSALFANSAIRAGEPSGYASWRGHVWSATDERRCGIPAACVRADSGLADYVEWALEAPLIYLIRDGAPVSGGGRSFREHFAAGGATEADWELHLSTLFPEVRFRPQLELRCADSGCPDMALALAALVKGVFYAPAALRQAWELTAGWSPRERVLAWRDGHHRGLSAPLPDGHRLLDYARWLVDLAELDATELPLLAPLHRILEQGASAGEQMGRVLEEDWSEDPVGDAVRHAYCLPGAQAGAPRL